MAELPAAVAVAVDDSAEREFRKGLIFGLAAYTVWGVLPIYLKGMSNAGVGIWELVAHRVLWSLLLLVGLMSLRRGAWLAMGRALASRRTMGLLVLSASMIFLNWVTYLYAVEINLVRHASLGYYINPLVSVLLGRLFLGERLRPLQAVALGLAGVAVVWQSVALGELPWISLVLAATFAVYGLCRKVAPVDAMAGLTFETALAAPLCVWLLLRLSAGDGQLAFTQGGWRLAALLVLSGVITAAPLVCFSAAARRLPLSTMGFMQYLSPTLQLGVAVLMFGEPFTQAHLVAFVLIWTALGVFSWDMIVARRSLRLTISAPGR